MFTSVLFLGYSSYYNCYSCIYDNCHFQHIIFYIAVLNLLPGYPWPALNNNWNDSGHKKRTLKLEVKELRFVCITVIDVNRSYVHLNNDLFLRWSSDDSISLANHTTWFMSYFLISLCIFVKSTNTFCSYFVHKLLISTLVLHLVLLPYFM